MGTSVEKLRKIDSTPVVVAAAAAAAVFVL